MLQMRNIWLWFARANSHPALQEGVHKETELRCLKCFCQNSKEEKVQTSQLGLIAQRRYQV